MNEDNSILSPQSPPTPVIENELQNLSPNNNYNAPSTTRNFPVSDPNLKPLEVNLPKDIPVQPQQSQPQPAILPSLVPQQPTQPLPPIASTEQPQVFVNPNPPIQPNVSGIPTCHLSTCN